MMSDMRAGRINCIVVKDLSRLGRDYVETGKSGREGISNDGCPLCGDYR